PESGFGFGLIGTQPPCDPYRLLVLAPHRLAPHPDCSAIRLLPVRRGEVETYPSNRCPLLPLPAPPPPPPRGGGGGGRGRVCQLASPSPGLLRNPTSPRKRRGEVQNLP